jgi:hypothetical protein
MDYSEGEEFMRYPISYTYEETAYFSRIREDMVAARHELRWSSEGVLRPEGAPLPKVYKSSGDIIQAALPNKADRDKFWA